MKRENVHRAGFSLVEAIIAMLVVGVGIAGVMSMVFWMVRANGWSGNMTEALILGQDKLEDLNETPFAQIVNGSDTSGPFSRSWTISNNVSNRFKEVELEVAWTRPNGNVSRVVMQTLAANPVVPGVDLSPFDIDAYTGAGGGGTTPPETGGGTEPPPDDSGDPPPDSGGVDPVLDNGTDVPSVQDAE